MTDNKVISKLKDCVFRKKIVYTLCFVVLCMIDQLKGSADGRIQMIAVNCTGFVMAVIILSAYRLKDFVKIPYFVWTVIFLIGGVLAYSWGRENYLYQGRWITGILNVGIYGYIVIRIISKVTVERAFPKINKGLFILWLVMMVGMIISRNDSLWPFWFLVMFGCFYLTDYSKEELSALFESMINGLIIGFILVQGAAFVFRPYDVIRYRGMYANPNMNGLFYVVSYCAFLCKCYQLKQKDALLVWQFLTAILAGSMYGFALLTQGKTTLLAMVVVTVIFLVFYVLMFEKDRVKKFMGRGICLVLAAVLSFPLVYGCVRYLPAFFHHPIWFGGEYSVEKVHSFDPVDSEKYVSWNEVLENSFGRILWFVDFSKDEASHSLVPTLQVMAAESEGMESVGAEIVEAEIEIGENGKNLRGSGESEESPVLVDKEDINNPITLRAGIYQFYLHRLDFFGHKTGENGLWLYKNYFAPHAHNIFLQLAFDFGIPVCIMFILLIGAIAHLGVFVHKKNADTGGKYLAVIVCELASALVLFGMFEIDWQIGQNIFTLFFVGLYLVFHRQALTKTT